MPALEDATGVLARLACSLDAVVFRRVWRGFGTSINKLLYNDVATEAHFSAQVLPSTPRLSSTPFGIPPDQYIVVCMNLELSPF